MATDAITPKRPDGARGTSKDARPTQPTIVQPEPENGALIGDSVSNCQRCLGSLLRGEGEGLELGKQLL